jgi:hypothetical protein
MIDNLKDEEAAVDNLRKTGRDERALNVGAIGRDGKLSIEEVDRSSSSPMPPSPRKECLRFCYNQVNRDSHTLFSPHPLRYRP